MWQDLFSEYMYDGLDYKDMVGALAAFVVQEKLSDKFKAYLRWRFAPEDDEEEEGG